MRPIYLDANILVLAFERPRAAGAAVWQIFDALEVGEFAAVTSEITLSEVLPKPLALGQGDLVSLYEKLFSSASIFKPVPISIEVLSTAARIRADRLSIRLPDAIHLATARLSNCLAFVTADKRLAASDALPVISPDATCLNDLRTLSR